MCRIHRFVAICVVLSVATRSLADGSPYVAFSLREAARRAQKGQPKNEQLANLGGITRFAGMVLDEQNRDFILVGKTVPDLPPARLDDLVVALRLRLGPIPVWPRVSIDPPKDPTGSGRQVVRFWGNLAGTTFGQDMLECDIILKHYSLEALPLVKTVKSYKALCVEDAVRRIKAQGKQVTKVEWLTPRTTADTMRGLRDRSIEEQETLRARFWFTKAESWDHVLSNGVLCINELNILVVQELDLLSLQKPSEDDTKSERTSGGPAKEFAQNFTLHLDELERVYPRLKSLKTLYDLTAIAECIRELRERGPSCDYFLTEHRLTPGKTDPDVGEYDLCCKLDRDDGRCQVLRLTGGVEIQADIEWLMEGDVTSLRRIVLQTRPREDSLCWPLPIEGWQMPNTQDLSQRQDTGQAPVAPNSHDSRQPINSSVRSQSYTLGPASSSTSGKGFVGFDPPPVNGVFVNPTTVKDATPLGSEVKKAVLRSRQSAKGAASKINIPPLSIEDEEFQRKKPRKPRKQK